jgi:hypothetical protein
MATSNPRMGDLEMSRLPNTRQTPDSFFHISLAESHPASGRGNMHGHQAEGQPFIHALGQQKDSASSEDEGQPRYGKAATRAAINSMTKLCLRKYLDSDRCS